MSGKFEFNAEEWVKLLDLSKKVNEKNSFFPKEELHHSDCSGKGPANTPIIRHGHEWIHESVADVVRDIGYHIPRGTFNGDVTTLKIGNNFYGKEEPLSYATALLIKAQEKIDEELWRNTTPPANSLPKTYEQYEKLCDSMGYSIVNYPSLNEPKLNDEPIVKDWMTKNLEEASASFMKQVYADLVNKQEPSYKAVQEHWKWKNPTTEHKSLHASIHSDSPSLNPNCEFKDPYLTQNDNGNKIINALFERINTQKVASYNGLANIERNLLEKARQQSLDFTPGNNNILLNPPLDTGGWGT